MSRSKEIDYYLRRYDYDSYIILDDDSSLFDEGEKTKNLYIINNECGFQKNYIMEIMKRWG